MNKSAYSIDEWCQLNSISRRTFYNLEELGKGPRTFNVGTRRLISAEADFDWRREREAAARTSEPEAA
jgi:predicted DNA-binding transcriptional regulator AlpA